MLFIVRISTLTGNHYISGNRALHNCKLIVELSLQHNADLCAGEGILDTISGFNMDNLRVVKL